MGDERTAYQASGEIPADVPTERWYQNQHRAELDQALVQAVELAQQGDEAKRARQLALQIRSIYVEAHSDMGPRTSSVSD